MIDWNTICQQKEMRGLGIRKAPDINKSLLVKLHWRLLMEKDWTWAHPMSKKYNIIKLLDFEAQPDHRASFI